MENGTRLFSISRLLLNKTQRFTDWTKTEQFRNNAKENFSTGLISDQTIWLQPVCQNLGKKTLLLTTTLNSVKHDYNYCVCFNICACLIKDL